MYGLEEFPGYYVSLVSCKDNGGPVIGRKYFLSSYPTRRGSDVNRYLVVIRVTGGSANSL